MNKDLSIFNLNGFSDVVITCDVDWAPDFAIEYFVNVVKSFGFKLTCFATHDSSFLRKEQDSNHLEVGIHPDFTKVNIDSTYSQKITLLKQLYPKALGSRSHRNIFGQNIAQELAAQGFLYDCSTVAWGLSHLGSFRDQYGLQRFMYFWEDGLHLDFSINLNVSLIDFGFPGLKIINFHPALFYLNSPNDEHRRNFVRKYKDLTIVTQDHFDRGKNTNFKGVQDFSRDIFTYLKRKNVNTHKMIDLVRMSL